MKIEEHLDHWQNPAMCIDPDNCPVVYASIMHEAERNTKPQTPFFEPSKFFYPCSLCGKETALSCSYCHSPVCARHPIDEKEVKQ